MAELTQQKPIIRITFDEMEAYMLLPEPEQGTGYTDSQIRQEMAARGITTGIDEQRISDMLEGHTYNAELLVAQGKKPVDGTDGYYEYKFDTNFDGKPKLLPDGSVDYWSVHSIESVTAGQVIAVYHPAVSGEDGMSVKGRLVPAKHGREQMPLKGKGFDRMDDEVTYTASMDGKIEMQNDRIVVLPVHEVSGNAELAEGNIDFRGDIVIHGNVESGVNIRATGSITIDGVAEACMLEAGKDIILRGGMLGGNKASVKTKGAITAKFFEFTNILCEGDLQADVLMDCSVICHGQIRLTGRKGSIIGGKVQAIRGLVPELMCTAACVSWRRRSRRRGRNWRRSRKDWRSSRFSPRSVASATRTIRAGRRCFGLRSRILQCLPATRRKCGSSVFSQRVQKGLVSR